MTRVALALLVFCGTAQGGEVLVPKTSPYLSMEAKRAMRDATAAVWHGRLLTRLTIDRCKTRSRISSLATILEIPPKTMSEFGVLARLSEVILERTDTVTKQAEIG